MDAQTGHVLGLHSSHPPGFPRAPCLLPWLAADGGYSITRVLTANLAADLTHRQFNDIRWGRHQGKSVLFAACSDRPRVDVIELVA